MNEKSMTLGRDYQGEQVAGWYISEKLDGVRGYWDGLQLWTRGGNLILAPSHITANLPTFPLDCELWAGRGGFQIVKAAVQSKRPRPELWTKIRLVAHDAPAASGDWQQRMAAARCVWSDCVEGKVCGGRQHLWEMFRQIVEGGGEGIMLRSPEVRCYEQGRTANLLKLKPLEKLHE